MRRPDPRYVSEKVNSALSAIFISVSTIGLRGERLSFLAVETARVRRIVNQFAAGLNIVSMVIINAPAVSLRRRFLAGCSIIRPRPMTPSGHHTRNDIAVFIAANAQREILIIYRYSEIFSVAPAIINSFSAHHHLPSRRSLAGFSAIQSRSIERNGYPGDTAAFPAAFPAAAKN